MGRRLFSDDQLERIYEGALRVLGRMGMRVESEACLAALERFGAQIDHGGHRARLDRDVIERALVLARADYAAQMQERPQLPREMTIGGGGTCPFWFDDESFSARAATEADAIRACRVIDASPVAISMPPVSVSDGPPALAPIRTLQLALETFGTTICCATDVFYPEQVPFVVELGKLYRDDPCWFLPAGNCPSSPLTVGKTIADLAVAKAPYAKFYAVPTMPVAGANAPVTPAGTAVVGVAEIIGGYVLAKALNPETPVGASALSAKLDMRTGQVVYVAPEVFVTDVAIAEATTHLVGTPCGTFGIYIDAKTPGMQAAQERLLRSTALAVYGSLSALEGTLDQGRVFSATQLMLDSDMHGFLAEYTADPQVSEETLGVEAILEVGWEASKYMMHEHTLEHMREGWAAKLPSRSPVSEQEVLGRARQMWREGLEQYESAELDEAFLTDLRGICKLAKAALQ